MRGIMLKIVTTMALAAGSTPALAQNVSAANPGTLVSALQGMGYQAKLEKDGTGDPLVRSSLDGSSFSILFYGCTDNRSCQTVQFYAGFKNGGKASVTTMNAWNQTKRFGRAYIDKDNDPVIEMDLDLDDGGMSKALFEDNVEFWAAILPEFKKHIAR